MTGVVSAEFSAPRGFEVFENRTHLVPVFEIYSPLYAAGTTRIIAVSEFYEDATSLAAEVRKGSLQAQTFVGVLMVGMLSFLFLIVQRGSELIVEQKTRLERKLEEQNSLLDLQDQLNLRIAKLHRECSDLSDRLLERIGADLHDGPAQLLGLALLRLHEVQPSKANVTQASDDALATVQSAMREALTEIRNISAGISLPELESLELNEILQLVVANHERRTKTHVARKFEPLPLGTSVALKTCLYRCGQEALNNAFLHALGKGQFLSATSDVDSITLTISDAGPGIEHARPIKTGDKLGLVGLRHRVELLGGTFQIASSPTTGTTVSVRLPLE